MITEICEMCKGKGEYEEDREVGSEFVVCPYCMGKGNFVEFSDEFLAQENGIKRRDLN